jgi:hypothetical protein
VWNSWLPLAASWLLMGAELPLLSAVVARLPDPAVNLAAYGGVVFPVALIIEAPIIMLLAASTALSRDWSSYRKLRAFMVQAGALLTGLHVLVAFTPLHDVVARDWIGAPEEVIEPARWGLMMMTPWTWAIASRRFHQGVLIRFGHSGAVWRGTVIRLLANAVVLAGGYLIGTIPGILVATAAVILGVTTEALYIWLKVRPVLRNQVKPAVSNQSELTTDRLLRFYLPLAMTPLITLSVQPILTGAISRMPDALANLAVWPAFNGLVFMIRSTGLAYNEVMVALLDRRGGYPVLRRFAIGLAVLQTVVLLVLAMTPAAWLWFSKLAGLEPRLSSLASTAMWSAILLPALTVWLSWYQGILLQSHRTRAITESVVLFLVICVAVLAAGVMWGTVSGLYVGMVAMTLGAFAQGLWQGVRSRETRLALTRRD